MSKTLPDGPNLSDAFKELEAIVAQLESGSVGLEEAIPKFKSGLELIKGIKSKLSKIENEIIFF